MTGATGVLLVGGASARFGSPKALARFGGETLAERAWRILGEAFERRLAVGKGDLELPFPVVVEPAEPRAPLVGVIAGLRRGRDRDRGLPSGRLPARHARAAARARRAAGGHADRPAAGRLREGRPAGARAAACRRATYSLRGVNPRVLDADPRLLANANTPDELSALERDLAALDLDPA